MDKHILEIDSVQKRYDNKLIVSDVYIKCETGKIIGLLGRNGSGKSTLLKIVFGIVPAEYKFIKIDGLVKSKTSQMLNDISYLHQENFLPNYFTVKKAVALSIKKENQAIFFNDDLLKSIKNKRIHHLSGGELRYLEINLILHNKSKFVLLDEPYNGLSPIMIEKINFLIQKNAKQKGIIITDHNYENVIKVSTELILMRNGKTHHLKHKKELIEMGYLSEGMI